MINYFIRFNSGSGWGLGHLHRQITIINTLKERGYQCYALINDHKVAKELLKSNGIKFFIVDEYETPNDVLNIVQDFVGNNILVFDRLDSDIDYFANLKKNMKIVVIDDDGAYANNAHVVINSRKNLPSDDQHFYGAKYQILRPEIEFFAKKNKSINDRVKNVLVHFGGTDPLRIMDKVYAPLSCHNDINFKFIAGKAAYNDKLNSIINKIDNCTYVATENNFAEALYKADIAILSGGVSLYECSAIGTPAIVIAQNDDQLITQNIFKCETGVIDLGRADKLETEALDKSFCELCDDYNMRSQMSKMEKLYVPCGGLDRLINILTNLTN